MKVVAGGEDTVGDANRIVQSIPASYTVWKDGTQAIAESNIKGGTDYTTGTDAVVIQNALAALTGGRTWKEKVVLRGAFYTTATINLPSFTVLEINGLIQLGPLIDNIIKGTNISYSEIVGGNLDGTKISQVTGNGIALTGSNNCKIHGTVIHDCKNSGILIYDGSYSNRVDNVYAYSNDAWGIGLQAGTGDCWGNMITNCELNFNIDGVEVTTTNGAASSCYENIVSNCLTRTNWATGIAIDTAPTATGLTYNNTIIGCTSFSNQVGIESARNSTLGSIVCNRINSNSLCGILISGELGKVGLRNIINGNIALNNGSSGAGSRLDGVTLEYAIENQICGNILEDTGVATQKYGVRETTGCDYNEIKNNSLRNNATAGVLKVGGYTVIKNNTGYITENQGASTGTGAEETIAHGLVAIPKLVTIVPTVTGATYSAWADATNIYPTVTVGKTYNWVAKVQA